ncbi:unnamed protein product [Phytomonas sp. Hart1]|nr:unnamed protein product [Phytomonas sp. Hart1]|eukprot:CCW68379.1 unnamed protein product [Phytomonas sp. isolate Hart1]
MTSLPTNKAPNPFKQADKINLPNFRDCYASFECSLKNLGQHTIMAQSPAYKLNRNSNEREDNENEKEEGDLTLISLNSTCSFGGSSPNFNDEEDEEGATIPTSHMMQLCEEDAGEKGDKIIKAIKEVVREEEKEGGEGTSPTTFNDIAFTPNSLSPPLFHQERHNNYDDNNYYYNYSSYSAKVNSDSKGKERRSLRKALPPAVTTPSSIEQRVSAIIPPLDCLESGAFAYYQPRLSLQERIPYSSSFMAAYSNHF